MRIGAVFPQTELGGDPGAVRAWAQRAGELGFAHVLAYDHVAGADPAVHAGWDGPYDVHTTFHEPMVLYGYLAAVTSMELVTGIIILPQRQTVLAAKQAAEVDLLTGGKFRLGVGIGWNRVEYEALGQDFSTRGKRLEEQITLLRRLWTEQAVTFSGTFDRITGAGLAPMPVQRPIPVWVGAQSPRLPPRRAARRRLVPANGPGPAARSGPPDRGGGSRRRRPRPSQPRHGRTPALAAGPRQASGGDAAMAGCRRHAPVGQHHGRRPEDRR